MTFLTVLDTSDLIQCNFPVINSLIENDCDTNYHKRGAIVSGITRCDASAWIEINAARQEDDGSADFCSQYTTYIKISFQFKCC